MSAKARPMVAGRGTDGESQPTAWAASSIRAATIVG
ncbi:MAG: hypothetical protein QOF84_3098 [Streptomyces sp.]|nr:hypothetical protein [Streptomyces sp.]